MATSTCPLGRRRAGLLLGRAPAVLGVLGVLAVLTLTPLAAGPARAASPAQTASPTPSPPSPPPCASDLPPFLGASPSGSPSPLPAPVSDEGGTRLALPGLQVTLAAGAAAPPAIRAASWVVTDLDSGAVIAACNAHVPLAPASTLKVLTAVALIHQVDPRAVYTARPEDAAIDGTKAGLVAGSRYPVSALWHGLLMSSANDCASALAGLAGGLPAATTRMQQVAIALGARDTVVVNTSGLDAPGQVSSAYDLAVFGRAALADPAITTLMRTRDYAFPAAGDQIGPSASPGRKAYQIQNHNRLLYNYPGATGVKNGYTLAAGGSFVGSATRGGHSYLVSMLRADTNTWRATATLLDWAFATGGRAAAVGALPTATPLPATPAAPTAGPAPAATAPDQAPPVVAAAHSGEQGPRGGGAVDWVLNGAGRWYAGAALLGLVGGRAISRLSSLSPGTRRPRKPRR